RGRRGRRRGRRAAGGAGRGAGAAVRAHHLRHGRTAAARLRARVPRSPHRVRRRAAPRRALDQPVGPTAGRAGRRRRRPGPGQDGGTASGLTPDGHNGSDGGPARPSSTAATVKQRVPSPSSTLPTRTEVPPVGGSDFGGWSGDRIVTT